MPAIVPAVAVKLAVVAPLSTVTEPGTVSAAALLDTDTTTPPRPAALESVTTQFDVPAELRIDGVHASEVRAGGVGTRVRVCVCELPFSDAVTIAVWFVVIVPAVAVKFAVAAPDNTVTEAGTVSVAWLLESATLAPPDPAACDRVTEQADVPPEVRLVGLQETRLTVVGATSRIEAVCELLLYDAVTTAVCVVENVPAVAVKFAEVDPAPTCADAGTAKAAALLESVTEMPPDPAACDSVTVQDDVPPAFRVVGLHETTLTVVGAIREIEAVCELPL